MKTVIKAKDLKPGMIIKEDRALWNNCFIKSVEISNLYPIGVIVCFEHASNIVFNLEEDVEILDPKLANLL
jgi:hypothetical protein